MAPSMEGAVVFRARLDRAVDQDKEDETKGREGNQHKEGLKIQWVLVLTVLLSTRHPQTGFLGLLSKDFPLDSQPSFPSFLNERSNLLFSPSVNLTFITSHYLNIWSFSVSFFTRVSIRASALKP